jgi:uncharacterized integral membrane protein (TIGR00698 family)
MQLPDLRFWREVLISAFLAVICAFIAAIPPFDHFGGISLALIAGMFAKALFWKPSSRSGGLVFAARTLLRIGIVLLGLRLNFAVLAHSGVKVIVFDLLMIVLGIALIMLVLRRAGFEPTLAALAAVGSSICGASAIAAAAPAIQANKQSSALAIVVCTLIGTFATFLIIPLQSIAGLAPAKYGILAGATLHEVAQVVAAVTPLPDAFQTGMAAKLLRVVFLAPVIAILPWILQSRSRNSAQSHTNSGSALQFLPWYVSGFLLTGLAVTLAAYLPDGIRGLVRRCNQPARSADQSAHRYVHGSHRSSSRFHSPAQAWSKADADRRNRLVSVICGDLCSLSDLAMTAA